MDTDPSILPTWTPWVLVVATTVLVTFAVRMRVTPERGYTRGQVHRERLIDRAPYFSRLRRRAARVIRAGERVSDPELGRVVYLLAWERHWYTFNPWQPRGIGSLTIAMLALSLVGAGFATDPAYGTLAAVPALLLAAYAVYEMAVPRRRAAESMAAHRGHATAEDPEPGV
ncbi:MULTISPECIES: hypothetical protein [unclassified Nocardiopsis]|uniref:hypothetical protein n=1 Tax=unclassified Nocardiopsis TaxID=2649073 RepID=UPI00066C7816|nr:MULTISPECIES: hypothetical protein [unclassified Nocardiopsis]MBQ1083518.1 hypothetical protein [Nocardiopsis sp. B62]